jgi:hypothetical protein
MSDLDRNEEVSRKIRHDGQWNGRQFRVGEYVALLDAEIVAVADSPEGALSSLRSIDPDPSRGMVVPVRPPVVAVIR